MIVDSNGNTFLVRGMKKAAVRVSPWVSVYSPVPGAWRDRAVCLEGGWQVFLSGLVWSALLFPWNRAGDQRPVCMDLRPHLENLFICHEA